MDANRKGNVQDFQTGIRTVLQKGSHVFDFGKEFSTLYPCPKTLCDTEFIGSRLIWQR